MRSRITAADHLQLRSHLAPHSLSLLQRRRYDKMLSHGQQTTGVRGQGSGIRKKIRRAGDQSIRAKHCTLPACSHKPEPDVQCFSPTCRRLLVAPLHPFHPSPPSWDSRIAALLHTDGWDGGQPLRTAFHPLHPFHPRPSTHTPTHPHTHTPLHWLLSTL